MNWQPIETAPKDSKSRLVWCPKYKNIFIVYWGRYFCQFSDKEVNDWLIFGSNDRLDETPTQWMPLPPTPQPAGEASTTEGGM